MSCPRGRSRRVDRDGGRGEGDLLPALPLQGAARRRFHRRTRAALVHGWLETQAKARGDTPEEQLLAVFDLLGEWSASDDFDGEPIKTLLETGDRQPLISQTCLAALQSVRAVISALAEQAGLRDPAEFALSCRILMNGALLSVEAGDRGAAKRAQAMARSLIDQHRQTYRLT